MREGQGRLYGALRKLYGQFQSYLDTDTDVEIAPVALGFSVTFRHDMDRFDANTFDDFLRLEEQIDAPSTLFFLQSQYTDFPERIGSLDRDKFELALHSEAKATPICWSLFQLSRLAERGYARRLQHQHRRFARELGASQGHAAHSVNNYLPFQGWINWNIIENASLRAGFAYVSDWRLPSRVAEGEEFMQPWPAYLRRRGAHTILVLPTCWDDKYFFYSYEDHYIRRTAPDTVPYRPRGTDEAWHSFLRQAESCRTLNTPCVLNIHPWHAASNGQPQFYDLKRRIIDWCVEQDVPIRQCREYPMICAHRDESGDR
jgi:hypothetical protein